MCSAFFLVQIILAQSKAILKGSVQDARTGAIIPMASIFTKNYQESTFSNQKGNYQLLLKKQKYQFMISSVGYHILYQNIDVTRDTIYNIKLEPKNIQLSTITLSAKSKKEIGVQSVSNLNLKLRPIQNAQDLLKTIPGLFIAQHAGGGKSEQIFLRGFDNDHGTDFAILVDDIPINLPSHAHGQGYADLHFLIPETIDKIDFGLGPYNASKGNFTTAGYVDFKTKQKLNHSSIKLEAGQFETLRALGMFNIINNKNNNAYLATEYLSTDGPFESSQNFNRINLFGKYSSLISSTDKIDITVSHFKSQWDASGQIPQRAVDSGFISRFGAIDDTEGGNTTRTNFKFGHDKYITQNSSIKSFIYASQYEFELFSNFTFFLEDPINGDQIRQKEERVIFGMNSEYNSTFSINDISGNFQMGISLRNDQTKDTELSHTLNRQETLNQFVLGDINETNLAAYIGTSLSYNKWTFNPSVRIDYFDFKYNDALLTTYKTQNKSKSAISPKFNFLYNQSNKLQFYLKGGKGFHSNDTRVVVAKENGNTLPAAVSGEVGFMWKPMSKMFLSMGYWSLNLEQEFVYVGDAGIVEPSGRTKRQGIDFNYRYQPLSWLFFNLDANHTLAQFTDESENMNYIPLAPDFTMSSRITLNHKIGIYGSVNVRYLDDRPANENNSIIAEGYTVTDLSVGYKWRKINLGLQIQNLFNTEWNETQFATVSRLEDEIEPIEEINFTPGTPFFIKSSIQYNF